MTKTLTLPSFEERTFDDCQAILVCLNNGTFVVVRHDEPKNLWPLRGGWQAMRRLRAGDDVIYKGERARVLALDVYR